MYHCQTVLDITVAVGVLVVICDSKDSVGSRISSSVKVVIDTFAEPADRKLQIPLSSLSNLTTGDVVELFDHFRAWVWLSGEETGRIAFGLSVWQGANGFRRVSKCFFCAGASQYARL